MKHVLRAASMASGMVAAAMWARVAAAQSPYFPPVQPVSEVAELGACPYAKEVGRLFQMLQRVAMLVEGESAPQTAQLVNVGLEMVDGIVVMSLVIVEYETGRGLVITSVEDEAVEQYGYQVQGDGTVKEIEPPLELLAAAERAPLCGPLERLAAAARSSQPYRPWR